MMKTLLITPQDISDIVKHIGFDTVMDKVISGLTIAFQEAATRRCDMRVRDGFIAEDGSFSCVEWMPHLNHYDQEITVKMIAYQPRNIARYGIPTVIGTTSLYDFDNGHLVALSDAVILTAIRTGATSAIASRILAHPDSSIVGLVGAGAQAVTQLHALSRVFNLREVLISDIDDKVANSFINRAAFLNLSIRICSLSELEERSDIICTVTSVENDAGPVIKGENLQQHTHINAVGADQPGKTELPHSLLKGSLICADFIPQAMNDGECQQLSKEDIDSDLFELVQKPKNYCFWRTKQTIFDSTGLALQDQVVLKIIKEIIEEEGLGKAVSLEYLPNDPHDPYEFMKNPEPTSSGSFSQLNYNQARLFKR